MAENPEIKRVRGYNLPTDLQAAADMVIEKTRAKLQGDALEDFIQTEKMFSKVRGRQPLRLTFELLPIKFRALEIPLIDIFNELGVQFGEPYKGFYHLDKALTSLTDKQLEKVKEIVSRLSDSFWHQEEGTEIPEAIEFPGGRIYYIFKHEPSFTNPWKERIALRKEANIDALQEVIRCSGRKVYPMTGREYAQVSALLNITPAWLFGWADGKTVLTASSPINEVILAGYRFLSAKNQTIVLRFIQELQNQEV